MARRRSRVQKLSDSYDTRQGLFVCDETSPAIPVEPSAQPTTGWSIQQKFLKVAFVLEEPQPVTFFLIIIYMDIILGTMSLTGETATSAAIDVLRRLILVLQCIELLLQLIFFHVRFFSHWGYCFDTILVGAKLINGQFNIDINAHHLQLLSFLRVWRFIRLVQSYKAIEISRHNRTKEELTSLIEYTKSAEEEIDILNEALTVAALDAAEMRAAQLQHHNDGDDGPAAAHDE